MNPFRCKYCDDFESMETPPWHICANGLNTVCKDVAFWTKNRILTCRFVLDLAALAGRMFRWFARGFAFASGAALALSLVWGVHDHGLHGGNADVSPVFSAVPLDDVVNHHSIGNQLQFLHADLRAAREDQRCSTLDANHAFDVTSDSAHPRYSPTEVLP